MSLKETEIHGRKFVIDTMDWHHSDDAAVVAERIEEEMMKWTAEYAARIHYLASECQNDRVEFDFEELADVRAMCAACADEILSQYVKYPDVGHNHDIAAIA